MSTNLIPSPKNNSSSEKILPELNHNENPTELYEDTFFGDCNINMPLTSLEMFKQEYEKLPSETRRLIMDTKSTFVNSPQKRKEERDKEINVMMRIFGHSFYENTLQDNLDEILLKGKDIASRYLADYLSIYINRITGIIPIINEYFRRGKNIDTRRERDPKSMSIDEVTSYFKKLIDDFWKTGLAPYISYEQQKNNVDTVNNYKNNLTTEYINKIKDLREKYYDIRERLERVKKQDAIDRLRQEKQDLYNELRAMESHSNQYAGEIESQLGTYYYDLDDRHKNPDKIRQGYNSKKMEDELYNAKSVAKIIELLFKGMTKELSNPLTADEYSDMWLYTAVYIEDSMNFGKKQILEPEVKDALIDAVLKWLEDNSNDDKSISKMISLNKRIALLQEKFFEIYDIIHKTPSEANLEHARFILRSLIANLKKKYV